MRIEIEKIVKRLPLNEYAAEYGEHALMVWVNPTRKIMLERMEQAEQGRVLREELEELRKRANEAVQEATLIPGEGPILERMRVILAELNDLGEKSLAWMSEILSQGPEDSRMSIDELKVLLEDCEEQDPHLFPWIAEQVWRMIGDYRAQKKKA